MNIIQAAQAFKNGQRVVYDPGAHEICLHPAGYLYSPGCPFAFGFLDDILSDKWTILEEKTMTEADALLTIQERAKLFVVDNFTDPTSNDFLIIETAMLLGASFGLELASEEDNE